MAVDLATTVKSDGARRRARAVRLSTKDRIAVAVMVGVPTLVVGALILALLAAHYISPLGGI